MSVKNSSTIKFDKNSELRRSRRIKLFFVFLLLVLLVVAGIIAFLRKKEFQISHVSVVGTKSLDSQQILDITNKYLSGHYAVIIPKTNTLLLSKGELSQYILDELPSLSRVTISFVEKNSIQVTVNEKKPSYVWCDTKCYFVDDTGMIYEESPQFTKGIFTTFSGGTIEGDPIKKYFISDAQFMKMQEILAVLDQLSFGVLGVKFGEDIIIYINSINGTTLGTQTSILVTPTEPVSDIKGALSLILNDKTFSGNVLSKGSLLQYIDIRFPEKIYYKFDTPVTQVTTQPTPNAKSMEKTQ